MDPAGVRVTNGDPDGDKLGDRDAAAGIEREGEGVLVDACEAKPLGERLPDVVVDPVGEPDRGPLMERVAVAVPDALASAPATDADALLVALAAVEAEAEVGAPTLGLPDAEGLRSPDRLALADPVGDAAAADSVGADGKTGGDDDTLGEAVALVKSLRQAVAEASGDAEALASPLVLVDSGTLGETVWDWD